MNFFIRYEKTIIRVIQGILVTGLLTPFIVGTKHLFPFVFPKALFFQFCVAAAFILFLGIVISNRRHTPKPSVLLVALGIWGLSIVLAGVFGFNFINSLWSKAERMDSIWFYGHLFAFCFMLISVFKTKEDWLFALRSNGLVGVAVGLFALASKYMPSFSKFGDQARLSGTFGNPSFLATYFVIFVFLCFLLVQYAAKRNEKIWWLCCAVFGIVLVLLSGTRGAYIGTAAGLGVWLLGLLLFGSRQYRKTGMVLVCVAFLLGGSFVLARPLWERAVPMVASRVYSSLSIPTQRLLVWQLGMEAFQARPLVGWGQENFIHAFNQYFNPDIFKYEVAIFDRPHNKIVDVLATTGAIGMASYVGLFFVIAFFLIRRAVQVRKAAMGWSMELGIVIGLIALWSAYHVQNLVLFEMPTSAIQMFFALALSLWFLDSGWNPLGHTGKSENIDYKISPVRTGLYAFASLGVVWSVWVGTCIPFLASRGFINAMVYFSQPMNEEYFNKGLSLYVQSRNRNTFLNKEFDINLARHIRNITIPRTEAWAQAYVNFGHTILGYLDDDMNRYREDYDILVEASNLMLDLYSKYRDPQTEALRQVSTRAIGYAPRRFEAYESLFLFELIGNNKDEAQRIMDQLFRLGPTIGDTWYYQALFDAQWGDRGAVIGDLQKSILYGFSLHDKAREQEWLLNMFVSQKRFDEASAFLEYLRTEPHAPSQYQIRYGVLQVEVVYLSGDVSRARLLLQALLSKLSDSGKQSVLQYLNSRGIIVEP